MEDIDLDRYPGRPGPLIVHVASLVHMQAGRHFMQMRDARAE